MKYVIITDNELKDINDEDSKERNDIEEEDVIYNNDVKIINKEKGTKYISLISKK